jgi:hypothetical protein
MGVSRRSPWLLPLCAAIALPLCADEIRLKDGKKLNGVIVGYEQNMFRVKTDFGYVLVEKDKIASIIPSAEAQPATQPATESAKSAPKPDSGTGAASSGSSAVDVSAKSAMGAAKTEKPGSRIASVAVRPAIPPASSTSEAVAPSIKGGPTANAALPAASNPATPSPQAEPPAIREDVQGNVYANHTQGFRMYKAPSWQVIDGARNTLPNAIVAMGTSNESTLMIVGREKSKDSLETAAINVEKRLYDVYENYQRASQRKTTVGGSPAVEFRYIGKADDHDWSGTLVVIGRPGEIFTVLGMTYADSDLIQIQQNVIAKAINSISFETTEARK